MFGYTEMSGKLRKREKEAFERRRVRIAMNMEKQREIQSKKPGEMRIAMAQDRYEKQITAEEIAEAQKKLVFVSYGGLQNVVNPVAENVVPKEKEKQKSFQTYQYCVDKQGGKLSCAGRLGTPPEILATANDALIKLAKKASYCEKHKTQKACKKLPNLIAINKRKEELKAKESIVASNNLW